MLGDGLCRSRAADGFHHHVVLQDGCLQVVELTLHDGLCLGTRQWFQPFHYYCVGQVFTWFFVGIFDSLKLPAGCHHLLHQQRSRDGFQEIVHSHLHLSLLCLRHGDHIHEAGCLLTFAVARTPSYNLYHLCQRTSHANGQAHLTPLPVEALFGCAQGDDDIDVVAILDILQISLHHIALFQTVFHQIGHLQQTAVSRPD